MAQSFRIEVVWARSVSIGSLLFLLIIHKLSWLGIAIDAS
jgi:hypothetical protein